MNPMQSPEHICVTVSETAADALEVPIDELPPLAEAIDPDALAALVSSTPPEAASTVKVTFSYAGLDVLVCSGNTVYVQLTPDQHKDII